jgi:hypothetical protein
VARERRVQRREWAREEKGPEKGSSQRRIVSREE